MLENLICLWSDVRIELKKLLKHIDNLARCQGELLPEIFLTVALLMDLLKIVKLASTSQEWEVLTCNVRHFREDFEHLIWFINFNCARVFGESWVWSLTRLTWREWVTALSFAMNALLVIESFSFGVQSCAVDHLHKNLPDAPNVHTLRLIILAQDYFWGSVPTVLDSLLLMLVICRLGLSLIIHALEKVVWLKLELCIARLSHFFALIS